LPVPPAFPTSSCPLQLSPSGESMTQESPFELLLTVSRMQHRVPRRTVSLHSAQASQRPCDGPVSSQQPAGYTILDSSRCPHGEGSTSAPRPPPVATPSVQMPPWFSCRDTAGKSARLRGGSCCPYYGRHPYPPHYRVAFAFSHPSTRTPTGWPGSLPTSRGGAIRAYHVPQG